MLVQFIALGKLIYVFGIPYGDSRLQDVPTEPDTTEGRTA